MYVYWHTPHSGATVRSVRAAKDDNKYLVLVRRSIYNCQGDCMLAALNSATRKYSWVAGMIGIYAVSWLIKLSLENTLMLDTNWCQVRL